MTAEQKALELYPVKYMDEKRGERKHPDLNEPLREAFMRGVENLKEELLEWAKQKQYESYTIVADNFWQEVIDKLNETVTK